MQSIHKVRPPSVSAFMRDVADRYGDYLCGMISLLICVVFRCTPPALDTIIGIQGDGFVMLAADPVLHRSLVVMQKVKTDWFTSMGSQAIN